MMIKHWFTHDWTDWQQYAINVKVLMGSGLLGKLDPPNLLGQWVERTEEWQKRTCRVCKHEERRLIA